MDFSPEPCLVTYPSLCSKVNVLLSWLSQKNLFFEENSYIHKTFLMTCFFSDLTIFSVSNLLFFNGFKQVLVVFFLVMSIFLIFLNKFYLCFFSNLMIRSSKKLKIHSKYSRIILSFFSKS